MRFALLLLVNGCVFIRPGEVIPWLDEIPVYAVVSLIGLAITYASIVAWFAPRELSARPFLAGALVMLAAVVVWAVANSGIVEAWMSGKGFASVFHYEPWLGSIPVYEIVFLTTLALSYPLVIAELTPKRLAERPVSLCALGMLVAIVVSHLVNGEGDQAFENGSEFTKVFLYYILFVALVDTPRKLELFLGSIALFAIISTTMAVLHYHKIVEIPAIQLVRTSLDDSGDLDSMIARLGSTGVFADPNDMCLMLVMAMAVCAYQIIENHRYYWAAPLALFGHALMLTHSRGGFLAMLGALVTLLFARYGRKAIWLGLVGLPAVFVVFAGRQTSLNPTAITGRTRLALWSEGMDLFIHRPLFGIGSNHYAEHAGHVAHNSFIHCYTELGLFGGTLFLSAAYLAAWPLVRLGGPEIPPLSPALSRLRPYVLAMIVGYMTGLMSLSCAYIIPTYTVLGLGAITIALAEKELGVSVTRLNRRLINRLALLSLAFSTSAVLAFRIVFRFDL